MVSFLKPIELWTGKQLFSILLRPNARVRVFVNLTVKEKNYSKPASSFEREVETMCPSDGFVYFRNSELLSGQLGKATLGKYPYILCGNPILHYSDKVDSINVQYTANMSMKNF